MNQAADFVRCARPNGETQFFWPFDRDRAFRWSNRASETKVELQIRNTRAGPAEDCGMQPTSAYSLPYDPLYAEHRRLWDVIRPLVRRLGELEAVERPSEDVALEIRLLTHQIFRLRRMTSRICEVLRNEGWARASAQRRTGGRAPPSHE